MAGPRKTKAKEAPEPPPPAEGEEPAEADGDAEAEDEREPAELEVDLELAAGTDLPDERLSELPDERLSTLPPDRPSTAPLARRDSLARWDPLQAYMAEVARHPVLSAEEQHQLAVKFAETGDVEAAALLVTSNLRLVVKIAYEYRRAHKNLMDLIQEGNIGLMQAVKRYDPYRGVKLSSYGAWWIRAYILRYILNNARLVKVGTTQAQRKLFFNLAKEKARLSAMGIEPDAKTIAANLKVTPKEVEEMDRRIGSPEVSIDTPFTNEEGDRGPTRGELLKSAGAAADDELIESQFNEALHQHLAEFGRSLQGKEREIFHRRLIAETPLTLQELGDEFGISRERVRQLEARLQQRLRSFLVDRMGDYLPFEAS